MEPPPRPLPEAAEPPASRADSQPDPAQPACASVPRTSLSWAQLLSGVFFVDALLCARCGGRSFIWAQLLLRVFFVDALLCTKCGGRMTVIAFLTDPLVVRRVLEHLQIPATPAPIWPARSDLGCSWPLHEETADELWPEPDPPDEPDAAFHEGTDRGRAPPRHS